MCKSYEANSVNNESEEPTVMPVTNDILNNSPEVEQMEAKKLEELEECIFKSFSYILGFVRFQPFLEE